MSDLTLNEYLELLEYIDKIENKYPLLFNNENVEEDKVKWKIKKKKEMKKETHNQISDYLSDLRVHLNDECLGMLDYHKYICDDTDEIYNRYKEFTLRQTENIIYLNYGIFIFIVDDIHYFKISYREGDLPIYLMQVLQFAYNKFN